MAMNIPDQEQCGLLRRIGVTRPELEFAIKEGTPSLVECLKRGHVYPRTELYTASVDLN